MPLSGVKYFAGDNRKQHLQHVGSEYKIGRKESPFWKETLELCSNSTWMNIQDNSTDSPKVSVCNPHYIDAIFVLLGDNYLHDLYPII